MTPSGLVRVSSALKALVVVAVFFALSACAVHFAPAYDESIEKDTIALQKTTSEFFARVLIGSGGSYASHKETYVQIQSTLSNLKLRATARGAGDAGLFSRGNGDQTNESAELFGKLTDAFEVVRRIDERSGLNKDNASSAQPSIDVIFATILEHENSLKR